MPTTRRPRPHPRPLRRAEPPLSARLDLLALHVEQAFGDIAGWHGTNHLVTARVPVDEPDAVEVGFVPVGGDIGDALAGDRVPASCDVVGVATLGWVRPLDDGGGVGPRQARARTVHLVHREGTASSVLHREGDVDAEVVPGPVEGRIPDLLLRSLGLPTPPAAATTAELWVLQWLGAVLEASAELATWGAVAHLHPAMAVLGDDDQALAVRDLGALARAAGRAWGWEAARLACAAGEQPSFGVDPSLAAWFDEGSFARHVLGSYPTVEVLCAAVDGVLPAALARKVRAVVRSSVVARPGPRR